jgi:hypothetical protein
LYPQGTPKAGTFDPFSSSVFIDFNPLSTYSSSGAATEIRFIQRVKSEWWDSSTVINHLFSDWHADVLDTDMPPLYGNPTGINPTETPWTPGGFPTAQMTDRPGADLDAPSLSVHVFETAAVVSKGTAKGTLLGSIWWGQILWVGPRGANSSLRWVSGSGEMNIAGSTRGTAAKGLWYVTGVGSYTQVAGAVNANVSVKKILPGTPSAYMYNLAHSI